MTAAKLPSSPSGLGAGGRALWKSVVADLSAGWELDARELHLLARACRCEDELSALEEIVDTQGMTVEGSRGQTVVHPALTEARQLRLTQLRLLNALELEDPAVVRQRATPASKRAAKAAEARWGRRRGAA